MRGCLFKHCKMGFFRESLLVDHCLSSSRMSSFSVIMAEYTFVVCYFLFVLMLTVVSKIQGKNNLYLL